MPEQFGTADAIILAGSELQIHDLKYGFLKVDAENNKQLQLYALGALAYFSLAQNFDRVRLFIHQPRLNRTSEWALSVTELEAFFEQAREAAAAAIVTANITDCEGVDTLPADVFTPGEKQCRWCKAADGRCKAETEYYLNLTAGDFVDLTQPLAPQLANAPKRVAALTPDELKPATKPTPWLSTRIAPHWPPPMANPTRVAMSTPRHPLRVRQQGNKGISASLGGVQFLRDDDAFGGGAPASEEDFEDLTVGANAEEFA